MSELTPEQQQQLHDLYASFQKPAEPAAPATPEDALHAVLADLDAEVDGVLGGTVAFGAAQVAKLRDAVKALADYVTGANKDQGQGNGQG